MNTKIWILTRHAKPDEGVVVETKIHDKDGVRNEQKMLRRGRIWYAPNEDFYVYYEPTHWRECSE